MYYIQVARPRFKVTAQKIVILGAGVAGLRIAKKLRGRLRPGEGELLLVDQNEYHQLLYRIHKVCNYDYEEKDIIIPLRRLIKDIPFKKATVESVDLESNVVKTDNGDIKYDILVAAMGSHPAFFGIEGICEYSLTLGSYEEAKEIRHRILELFDKAEKEKTPPNIVLGGAGFTGVELAGELCECLPKLYRDHKLQELETYFSIVEALPTILPGWDKRLIEKGTKYFQSKKVKLYFKSPVVKVGHNEVVLKDGKTLAADLFIWTGGVEGDPACRQGFETRARRIVVNDYLQPIGVENVFIAGDQACTVDREGKPVPPNAHIAMKHADIVVDNILAKLRDKPMKKYKFEHVGEVVTFGRGYAVGKIYGVTLEGLPAKIMKQIIHLWYLHSIGGFSLLLEYW